MRARRSAPSGRGRGAGRGPCWAVGHGAGTSMGLTVLSILALAGCASSATPPGTPAAVSTAGAVPSASTPPAMVTTPSAPPTTPTATPTRADPTGAPLTTLTGGPVLAVKVDNTGGSRPRVGLNQADVVYVEPVEGGLTRLLAIFSTA